MEPTSKQSIVLDYSVYGTRHTLERETFIEPDNTPYEAVDASKGFGVLLVAVAAFFLVCTIASHPTGAAFGPLTWLFGIVTILSAIHGGRMIER